MNVGYNTADDILNYTTVTKGTKQCNNKTVTMNNKVMDSPQAESWAPENA